MRWDLTNPDGLVRALQEASSDAAIESIAFHLKALPVEDHARLFSRALRRDLTLRAYVTRLQWILDSMNAPNG